MTKMPIVATKAPLTLRSARPKGCANGRSRRKAAIEQSQVALPRILPVPPRCPNMLLTLPKQPRAVQKYRQWPTPPQQPPRNPANLGSLRVIAVRQLKHAPWPRRATPQILQENSRGCLPDLLAPLRHKFDGRGTAHILAGLLEPDQCQRSCQNVKHFRCHLFPTYRSLSHANIQKLLSESMEKLQG